MTPPVHHAAHAGRELLHELQDLSDRLGRLWRSAVPGGGGLAPDAPWEPPADLEETDDAYILELDLPGLRKDEVSIEVRGSELSVRGAAKGKEGVGTVPRRTRRAGRFEFRMTLPEDTDPDKINAELAHGVLTVHFPRAGRTRPHRVHITG